MNLPSTTPENSKLAKSLSYAKRLRILDLHFEIEFLSDVVLPTYKGSALHGGFGRALRQMYCTCRSGFNREDILNDDDQSTPRKAQSCPYHFIFETRINDNAFRFLRNVPSVPHPYLFELPLDESKDYEAGEHLSFTIRLFGSATDYAVNVVEAIALFGKLGITRRKARFKISSVTSANARGKNRSIYDGGSNRYLAIPKPFRWKPAQNESLPDTVTVRFLTPARLVQGEHLRGNVDLSIIITSIARRLASLAYYAEGLTSIAKIIDGRPVSVDGSTLLGQATEWKDWRRYSNRQLSSMLFGGVVGEMTFQNVPEGCLELLQFGRLLHLGKQTTFGLGEYEIVCE